MPGGRTRFQEKWLETKDGNGDVIGSWCKKGKTEWEAYCLICRCSLSVSNGGASQLLQHATRQKHATAARQLKGQRTLAGHKSSASDHVERTSRTHTVSVAFSADQLATRAEALWVMKVAVSNFSFGSCQDIVCLFKVMFENNPVASEMQLSERKVSYILSHGLGPFFHNEFVSDLKAAINANSYFTLAFDEATTSQVKKQLDIIVRYWSPKHKGIVSAYLTSLFFGHASSEALCSGILNALAADNLPLNKVLMLSMDGPNVNLAVAKKINEERLNIGSPELLDVGTCSLHKVHNCFLKALGSLPIDIDEFATDVFMFFNVSAARREDLRQLENLLECEQKFLLRHVNSRWLTLGPVVTRLLAVYPALQEYFCKFLPQQKSCWGAVQNNARYKRIVSALKDPVTLVYLEFIASFASHVQSYLTLFQMEGPLIHLLFNGMNSLLRNIMLKFMKEESVRQLEGKKLVSVDIHKFENYKPLKDLDVGVGTRRALLHLKEAEAKVANMSIRTFMIKICTLLKEALPVSSGFLKDLENLHPLMRQTQTGDHAIRRLCTRMKLLQLDDKTVDKITHEWQAYKLDPDIDLLCGDFGAAGSEKNNRIDEFWGRIFAMTDKHCGQLKYSNISILVKNCLALSHGNSDVERGFSLNRNILLDNRSNLGESTIIGIRNVKDAVKRHGDICSVPITAKLLNSVRKAHSAYVAAKEEEKKRREEQNRKRILEEEEERHANETKKLKKEVEDKIKEIEQVIANLQDDLLCAQKCLSEGNDRLQKAIKAKNFSCMKIASTMIDAGNSKVQDITKQITKSQEERYKLQFSLKH